MRYLLDEDVSPALAPAMAALWPDDEFDHIVAATGGPGTQDDDIPPLCRSQGYDALVTINVRDFGARQHYYAALSAHQVHVVVMRPGKAQPDKAQQATMLIAQFGKVRAWLAEATEPKLVVVRRQDARMRTIDELVQEIEAGRRDTT